VRVRPHAGERFAEPHGREATMNARPGRLAAATTAAVALVAACLGSSSALGQYCPFPMASCPPPAHDDFNCDGKAASYCAPFDRDGAAYGDCTPDGISDDFWTFYDGDFNGTADPCDPNDVVEPTPDGIADGLSASPACDRKSQDRFQQYSLTFYHAYTLLIWNGSGLLLNVRSVDVIRGHVDQLAWGASQVDLGPVVCIKNDGTVVTDSAFVVNDLEDPPPGEAWFYLARWNVDPPDPGAYPYGFAECLPRTTTVLEGDCPP
jgi:hypothetical protein